MDNRKTITLIILLLLLLLCWHICKRKARVLPCKPVTLPQVAKPTERPAYLGKPVIDAFAVDGPVITYISVGSGGFKIAFNKAIDPDSVSADDFIFKRFDTGIIDTITIISTQNLDFGQGLLGRITFSGLIGSDYLVTINSGRLKSIDGGLFAGVIDRFFHPS